MTSGRACITGRDVHIIQQTPDQQADSININLLLLGSEGHGKSATGNSILGRDVFKVRSFASTTSTSSKSNIAKGTTELGDVTVSVIDGPAIPHSGELDQDYLKNIISSVKTASELCDYAFNAIMNVMKFGIRFTKQEAETIKLIKSLPRENVIKDYGICVITHGDNFEHDVKKAEEFGEDLTFESWCSDQRGDVKNLFDECNFKRVLFDNRTKDENKKQNQLLPLVNMVHLNKRYSKEEFVKAEGLKEQAFKEIFPHLEKKTKALMDQISQRVEDIEFKETDDPNICRSKMNPLLAKLKTRKDIIFEYGENIYKAVLLFHQIRVFQSSINIKIKHSTVSTRSSPSTYCDPLCQDRTAETEARVMLIMTVNTHHSKDVMEENDGVILAKVKEKWRIVHEYYLMGKKNSKLFPGLELKYYY